VEIVALDAPGRMQSTRSSTGTPYFYAFDCLWIDGCDIRCLPLVAI
jgi:hypothetical protein